MKQKTNTGSTHRTSRVKLVQQMVRYAVSGGAYFWSGYIVFAILYSGLDVSVGWSKILSNGFGLAVNFVLQRWWVFRNPDAAKALPETSARYIFLMIINFVIDYGIVVGLADLGLTPYLGQFVSAGFFTVWNYLWYKLWVFAPHPRLTHRPHSSAAQRSSARHERSRHTTSLPAAAFTRRAVLHDSFHSSPSPRVASEPKRQVEKSDNASEHMRQKNK